MFQLLSLTFPLFLAISALKTCPEGFKKFQRAPTDENHQTEEYCLGVITANKTAKNQNPTTLCSTHHSSFSFPENYEEAEWLWNQTHVGDGILIHGLLTVQCNTTNVNGKIEGLCDYDDDNRKKDIQTIDYHTDPALVKFELVFHPELELYSVPKTLPSVRSYEAYCPLFLKKQVWYNIPRWVDVKYCTSEFALFKDFGKDGRWSVVCGTEPKDA